MPKLRIVFIRL